MGQDRTEEEQLVHALVIFVIVVSYFFLSPLFFLGGEEPRQPNPKKRRRKTASTYVSDGAFFYFSRLPGPGRETRQNTFFNAQCLLEGRVLSQSCTEREEKKKEKRITSSQVLGRRPRLGWGWSWVRAYTDDTVSLGASV